ncbi:TIGR00282 family metallophosphoesterase [Marinicrinis sediminis]|uniref:TIGR00282 family metallophosphoesterase n=1 Tax=Marinicrinis sediminis TaxID=1652465 RepID=A0ABW5R5K1_9BACL
MKVVFVGDVVGSVGRKALKNILPYIKKTQNPDFLIVNGENAAGGKGITPEIAKEIYDLGAHGITLGNHSWDKREIFEYIDEDKRMIRPANFPLGTPGKGYTILKNGSKELAIVNVQGRTFLPPLDCPFAKMDQIVHELPNRIKHIFVDFHAEATSEKIAMGWHLDGKVSAVVGTHTHVQTHDEQILPQGTAYVTDVGMVGSREGVLGMEREAVLRKFMTQLPVRFVSDSGKWQFHGISLELDDATGKAKKIKLLRHFEDEVRFE